jgi:hypothetical protein
MGAVPGCAGATAALCARTGATAVDDSDWGTVATDGGQLCAGGAAIVRPGEGLCEIAVGRRLGSLKPTANMPIALLMSVFFQWALSGLAGLVFVAVVVAWWEYLGQRVAQHEAKTPHKPKRAASVDVELDALAAMAQGTGDVYERQQTLGGAIARMAGAMGQGWTDTAPMIGMGQRATDRPRSDPVTQ